MNEPECGSEAGAGTNIRLIVGLGNPGREYAGSRHNVGFWCLNRLARRHGIAFSSRGRLAAVGEGELVGRPVILAKPRTFVNLSGRAVSHLLRRYRLSPQQLLVVCDDLDLPLGRVRLRARGSHGGHKGMRSIIEATGSQDFPRIRIGIGRPQVAGEPTWEPEHVVDYVLSPMTADERRILDDAVATAGEAILCLLSDGVEAAMNQYNR
jgi:PTH1 family peptidyl-tRNA hydrolase